MKLSSYQTAIIFSDNNNGDLIIATQLGPSTPYKFQTHLLNFLFISTPPPIHTSFKDFLPPSSPALFSLIQFISFFSPWQQIIIRFFFPSILKSKIHSFNSLDCKYTVCMQHNSTKNLLPTLHTPNFLSIFNRRGSELRLSVYICKLTSSSFVYMKNYSATKKPSRERNRG